MSKYINIEKELKLRSIPKIALVKIWNVRPATVYDKLNGKSDMTVGEIRKLRDNLLPDCDLDYLSVVTEGVELYGTYESAITSASNH